jgi:hypothetical protein
MKGIKQQLIIVFDSDNIHEVEQAIDTHAKDGPRYNSPKGQIPMVVSVLADATELFEALHLSKADFIMTSIGMESENVFSQGELSQSLFFSDCKKRKKTNTVYKVALQKALEKEDYEEASIIRDIIAKVKSDKDLIAYRLGRH